MSGSQRKKSTLELGHDAFLDIVANLVGILIILVVVLGTQSTAVIEEIKDQIEEETVVTPEREFASDEQLSTLARYSMRAASAQADSNRFEQMIKQFDSDIETRRRQRAELLDLVSESEAAWDAKKTQLDRQTTLAAERQTEFDRATEQLAKVEAERRRLEDQPEPVVAVDHLPTPMAKTVFGEELHFRLKDNRLSLVPIEKLLKEIGRDFERIASSSRREQLDAAVGPIRDYVARYQMDIDRGIVSRGGRIHMVSRARHFQINIEPLSEPHGQPIDELLAGRSELDIELAGRDPNTTTVTVWVYPDSFASFRRLKEHLYARGFATAARPLPPDYKITVSTNGSKSNAQ